MRGSDACFTARAAPQIVPMKKISWLYGGLIFLGGLAGGMASGVLWHAGGAGAGTATTARPVAAARKIVTASEFVLTDAADKPRARISVGKHGTAVFAMYDGGGHPRAEITVNSRGAPSVKLYDTVDRPRLVLDVNTDGIPTVRLLDSENEARTILGVDAEGEPGLNFYGRGGKLMRELP